MSNAIQTIVSINGAEHSVLVPDRRIRKLVKHDTLHTARGFGATYTVLNADGRAIGYIRKTDVFPKNADLFCPDQSSKLFPGERVSPPRVCQTAWYAEGSERRCIYCGGPSR